MFPAAVGCVSLYVAILILVIAVAVVDRPALAPAEGPVDLGYKVVANGGFLAGMTACLVIFVSSSGTAAFVPM